MYVYKRQVTTFRGIATLVSVALVLWALGVHMFTDKVEAANLTNVSDTLSDSEPGGTSLHTIRFTMPNGMSQGQTFTIDFASGFDISSIDPSAGDITLTNGGGGQTVAAAPGAGQWGAVVGGNNSITFTTPTDGGVASSTELVITIGDLAGNLITNPSATTSYQIGIGNTTLTATTTSQDGGYAMVAIIENVLVTAQINTTFSFTVGGVPTSAAVGNGVSTDIGTTNTTIPFGVLSNGVPLIGAQRLNVSTNAINGYVVTAEIDTPFESSTGADIDSFIDASATNTPVTWASPTNNVGNENTWGHWGITSTDDVIAGRTDAFSSTTDLWIGPSTTPRLVMGHTGPSDGTTNGVGSTTVGFQVEITALQEAGDDYNTTLTYIATPTF